MAEDICSECGSERPHDAPQGLCPTCLTKAGRSGVSPSDQSDIPTGAMPTTAFVPPDPGDLAGQIPNLEILRLLGQGGMGAVYEARQTHLDRSVALKVLPPHIGRTKAFSERFLREARSLARLNHARIISVYDFGCTESELYYFIMEFVDGMDLRRMIQSKALSVPDILSIVPQVCDALEYAHEEGIVHRDIKPENILLNKKGEVKIADFGLAKLMDQSSVVQNLTQVGQIMGTPQYMAPEQIERPAKVDHRADIYSLGVVFYEMLTGELPLGRFAPPSQQTHTDTRLDPVVLRALNKLPDDRYQQARDIKTDVETILSGRSVTVHDSLADIDRDAICRRLQQPARGLRVAGVINCAIALPVLLVWMGVAMGQGPLSPVAIALGVWGAILAGMGLFTRVAARKMLQLQSYGWVITASLLQLIPSPGFVVGLWFGLWSLALITRHKTHTAFFHDVPSRGLDLAGRFEKITLALLALSATFALCLALLESLWHGRLPWLLLLGLPLVFLDAFALGVCTGRADLASKLWQRAKAKLDRTLGR